MVVVEDETIVAVGEKIVADGKIVAADEMIVAADEMIVVAEKIHSREVEYHLYPIRKNRMLSLDKSKRDGPCSPNFSSLCVERPRCLRIGIS